MPQTPAKTNDTQAFASQLSELHRSICHLRTTRTKALWTTRSTGSAALVEGRYLVTAGHNVADFGTSWLQYVQVSCGSAVADWSTVDVAMNRPMLKRLRATPLYAWKFHNRSPSFEYDFAFVDLGQALEYDSGFVIRDSVRPRIGETVFLGGYPGDGISSGDSLFVGTGRVEDINGNLLSYDITTTTGNSGGPLWIVRRDTAFLVGVHVKRSTGRLLNESFYDAWRNWRAEIGTP